VSRKPETAPDALDGYFQLTIWRLRDDANAAVLRARWRASLAVLGVRTLEVESGGLVALYREGEEAASASTARVRRFRSSVTNHARERF
jgi:hypothetical protein